MDENNEVKPAHLGSLPAIETASQDDEVGLFDPALKNEVLQHLAIPTEQAYFAGLGEVVDNIVNRNYKVYRRSQPDEYGMTLGAKPAMGRRVLETAGLDDGPQRVVEAVSESTGSSLAFSITFMLGAIGAAAGNRITTRVGVHTNHPPLWCVVVAPTGSGKSPTLKVFTTPAEERQQAVTRDYKEELRQWRQSDAKGQPPRKRIMYGTGHATLEAMTAGMETNGGNLFIAADELKNWFGSLDRYHGKGDNSTDILLQIYGYSYIEEQRKTAESVSVENPCLALVGGIQPARAFNLFADAEWLQSGLTARFLFCYEPNVPVITKSYPLPDDIEPIWRAIERAVSQCKGELLMSRTAQVLYDEYNAAVAAIATGYGEASPERCALSKVAANLCRLAQCVALVNGHDDITGDDMLYSIDCLEYYRQCVFSLLHRNGSKAYREPKTALDRAETINRWRAERNQPPLKDTQLADIVGVSTAALSLAKKRRSGNVGPTESNTNEQD